MRNPKQQHKSLVYKVLILTSLLLLFFLKTHSQNREAYVWYFGHFVGVDFKTGSPPEVATSAMEAHAVFPSSIADSNGNLLFYSNGRHIWNRNHTYMQNGENIGNFHAYGSIIIPKPGSDHLYYFFSYQTQGSTQQPDFVFSLIDMNLDNGLGGVVAGQKNIFLLSETSFWCLTAVQHGNDNDVWVVTHDWLNTHTSNNFYAFLITSDSVHRTPIRSYTDMPISGSTAFIKLSPNGKKIIGIDPDSNSSGAFFSLIDFNDETGIISDTNELRHLMSAGFCKAEFSPDNSKLYISMADSLFQYDLNAGSHEDIINSETLIHVGHGAIQIAPDGKIYQMADSHYLNVINRPNELGGACNYEEEVVSFEGLPFLYFASGNFPIFIQSFFDDPIFTTQNHCIGDATTFEIDDIEGIDSVFWKFDDFLNMPHDTSTLFNPVYTFSHAGIYNVELTVYFDLIEKIIKQDVIIHPLPEPKLGNDTLFCDTSFSIVLNANCEGIFFVWNGIPGGQEITIGDTGTYWVRVVSDGGCVNSDTINIGLYPQPQIDETNLVVTHADCGQNNGSIEGLHVVGTPPLAYYWVNLQGDTICFNIDVLNLPAGAYSLIVAYGECSSTMATYLVHDIGDLQIDSVTTTNDYCNTNSGIINIYADAINPNLLTYSIDEVNFFPNNGIFNNLAQGSYMVMIKDTNYCEGLYINNPVIIQNIGGPEITTQDVTPENDFSSDGSIFLEATVASGDVYYSIYNGNSPQTNNGLFQNLSAGLYYCKVWDEFGCDTIFDVIVPRNTTTLLEAISGFGSSCVGNKAVSPLELTHFNDVYSFDVKISYDTNVVSCDGYINLNPELEEGFQASIITTLGEIHLTWQGLSPTSLPDHSLMAELVFNGLIDGVSPVFWEAGPEESVFFNQEMDTITAMCYVGDVQIYSLPEIQMQPYQDACAGDSIDITPTITQNNGDVSFNWSGPNGYESQNNSLLLSPVSTNQAGTYTLLVEDSMYCKKTDTIEINIAPSPTIAFSEYDTLWVDPGFILEAGYGAEHYQWNTGETSETIVIDSMGKYIVLVTSYEGCKSSDAVQILWGGHPFYIPNAFTPNNDGLNDTFGAIPKYDYVNKFHMSIYNRWGQMIFETTDINQGWDGTYQGSPCMVGVYVYRIVYEEFGQQPIESKFVEGTVMLVR